MRSYINMRSQPSPSLPENSGINNNETRGVSVLTGDPKSAIRKLAGPMFIAMLLMTIYNIVDAFWVAGLGSDALAAVGFMTPLFMVLIGFGNGIGAGATSAISRKIGAKDKPGADLVASHSILIMLIISVVLTAAIVPNITAISLLLGAGDVAGLAADYGLVIFSGTVFVLFTNVVYGMLRAEGDTKRTMYAMAVSSVINIVLDPVLIYYFNLGVAGAALATVISIMFVTVILFYRIHMSQSPLKISALNQR
jgi:putative MATE family efflux protein